MKKILMMVIILVLGLSVQSKAQEYRIELDPHGNSIIYSCTENAVYVETPTIVKINANGSQVWRIELQGSCGVEVALRIDPKGDILVSISDYSMEANRLSKFDTHKGTRRWNIAGLMYSIWSINELLSNNIVRFVSSSISGY
jgi:outer membrane protein assembly factor BamB